MDALLLACQNAFIDSPEHFRVISDAGPVTLTRRDYRRHARQRVIWPLESHPRAIGDFLSALLDGVKPMVVSPKTAPIKRQQLQSHYQAGQYQEGEISETTGNLEDTTPALLYVMTSGSTGLPKAVAASADRLGSMIEAIHESQELEQVDSVLACLPLGFSSGLINQLLWAVYYRRTLHLPGEVISPAALLAAASQFQSQMLCFVNTQIKMIAALTDADTPPLRHVKVINFSGESFPEDQYRFLKQQFPCARLLNNYGCTEAMPRIAMRDVTNEHQALSHNVGTCIPGTRVRIKDGQACGPIEFASPHSALGYLDNRGELICFNEWTESGDAGEIINGELYLSGRCDQVVKLGGERHSLRELELAATQAGYHSAVALLDKEKISLVVHGLQTDHKATIRRLRSLVAPMLRPSHIYLRDNWPLLPNSKVDRQRIIQHYHSAASELHLLWPPAR